MTAPTPERLAGLRDRAQNKIDASLDWKHIPMDPNELLALLDAAAATEDLRRELDERVVSLDAMTAEYEDRVEEKKRAEWERDGWLTNARESLPSMKSTA